MSAAKKSHWLRNTVIVLLICGIAGTVLAAVQFRRDSGRIGATASLQFSFEGAAEGLAPNGNMFNLDGLSSDEVIEAALKATELEGTYTVEQLRENLVATGSYPDDLVKQVMSYESLLSFTANRELTVREYAPTLFKITLYNDFDSSISQSKLVELLKNLLECYRGYFIENYGVNLSWENDDIFTLDEYDYPQQLDVLQEVMSQQARYAQEMYEKEPTFQLGGKGFNDIYVQFNSLIENDVTRLNANITINALTRNTARLLTQYQFEIRDLNNELEKKTDQLKRLEELLDSYEKNEIIYLSTTDSLTKIDGNSSETYDSLVANRKDVSDEITRIKSRMETYQLRLIDLMGDDATQHNADEAVDNSEETGVEIAGDLEIEDIQEMTEEEIAAAAGAAEEAAAKQIEELEKNIAELIEKQKTVTEDFKALLNAYTERKINEQTVRAYNYKYNVPKLLSGNFAMRVIKTAGPLCALGFMLCMILMIAARRKEQDVK